MLNKKIRIAFFADVMQENLDGVTRTVHHIIKGIDPELFEVVFITAQPPVHKIPFTVHIIRSRTWPPNPKYPIGLPFFNKKLREILKDFSPHFIHFTSPSLMGLFAVKYGKKHKIPVFATYHTHFISYQEYYFVGKCGPLSPLLRKIVLKFMRWFYNSCSKIFVPSGAIISELEEHGIKSEKLFLWSRGIEMEIFNPSRKDERHMDLLAGKNTKRVLFVSRLVWEKELAVLAEVSEIIRKKDPSVKFIVTGDGPAEKELRQKMPHAVFTGFLEHKALARIYASSDVFFFPSITETFGNVVLESLACGTPAVVATQGGPAGIVEDGISGFHSEPKNSKLFADCILKILHDENLKKTMTENAVAYAEKQNWPDIRKRFFNEYEKQFEKYYEKNKD
ncbi:MAG: glycosyltransferase family 1 protein [bacterium]